MIHNISGKQHNSKMCFVCGLKNRSGLKTYFYETDKNELIAVFQPLPEHQGYPGRLHGGIAAAILDEAIGRAITIGKKEEVWSVTIEFSIKYKKPVPLDGKVRAVTRITCENKRIFEGTGEIINPDGEIAATGKGKYIKMPIDSIGEFDREANEWQIVREESDPVTLEI